MAAEREPDVVRSGYSAAWFALGLAVLGVLLISVFAWLDHNPGAIDWDNAEYINLATHDYYAYQRGGLGALIKSLLTRDPARPPGFRFVVLPVTLTAGVSPLILRLTSVLIMGVMVVMIYVAVSRCGGSSAGILAAALVSSLVVVHQSMRIYRTETALYPCVVGVLLCLIVGLHRERVGWPLWVGLGLWLGLGILSKVTFASIGGPVVLTALAFAWHGSLGGWRCWHLVAACAIGGAIGGPFYLRNVQGIMASAHEAAYFARHSYDAWSPRNIGDWLGLVFAVGVGWGATLLIVILAAASTILVIRRPSTRGQRQLLKRSTVSVCLCVAAGLPIIASQLLLTRTFTTRHVSPGYIALAMATCIAAGATSLLRFRLIFLAAVVLFYVQLSAWMPEALSSRRDVWDWEQVYQAATQRNDAARIIHLGNGTSYNPPFIQAPWVRRGEPIQEHWLWRFEEGPIDWERIEKQLANASIVLTAPGYIGELADRQDRDNIHNDELVRRLRGDSRFDGPVTFEMGGYHDHATVMAFFRRSPPLRSWRVASGLASWEGPYPHLRLPFAVRWGLGPETRMYFVMDDGLSSILRLRCLSYRPRQSITMLVDGHEVGRYSFDQVGVITSISVPLRVAAGEHEVTLRYASWSEGPRAEAVLFQKIDIVSSGD